MPAVSAPSPAAPPRFRLVHPTGSILLAPGALLIGRDPECDVPVDDPLVSRHHARVATDTRGTLVVDLGSINGTWVNGERIDLPHPVSSGDKLVIGQQTLEFVDARSSGTRMASPVPPAPTAHDSAPPRPSDRRSWPSFSPSEPGSGVTGSPRTPPVTAEPASRPGRAPLEKTGRADAFELLGALADKALAVGQNERAVELAGPYLRNIVTAAREGSAVSPETRAFVTRYTVKLASAVGDAAWVDLAFELYTLLRMPLPAATIDELGRLRLRVPLNRPVLRRYVDVLRASVTRFDARERELVQRLAGLDSLPGPDRR